MQLSEDKAKEILDFLAKKAGYEWAEISWYPEYKYRLEFCGSWIGCFILAYDNILDCYRYLDFKDNSYVVCLKRIIELSSKNFSIVTDSFHSSHNKETCVVEPCTTLESLLVEYDLSVE